MHHIRGFIHLHCRASLSLYDKKCTYDDIVCGLFQVLERGNKIYNNKSIISKSTKEQNDLPDDHAMTCTGARPAKVGAM